MSRLIDETPDAKSWVEQTLSVATKTRNLGRLGSGVIWTDGYLEDGEPIGGSDPSEIINEIQESGLPLLHQHDPGCPVGRLINANSFTSPDGTLFVAAIMAFYEPNSVLNFASLDINPFPEAKLPAILGLPRDARIQLAADPRDVPHPWIDELSTDAPLSIERMSLSLNDANSLKELIHIALPYAALLWNPLVMSIGEQAGKDIYEGVHQWLEMLWKKLKDLRDPILDIQAHHNECTVSFLFRGNDVEQHYAAHAALPAATAQAAKLIDNFEQRNLVLKTLVYEFKQSRWIPSYGVLASGQLVSDSNILIAHEQLPKELSIGRIRRKSKSREH